MSIPVIEDSKVRFIFGVGNKRSDYEQADVRHLELVANDLHKIIKQVTADAEISKLSERFRTYIDSAPSGILIADLSGRFVDVNPAAIRLFGYSKEELLALTMDDIHPPELRHEVNKTFDVLKESSHYSSEVVLQQKDGTPFHALLDVVKLSDDRFMAFCSDMTEHWQLQEQLFLSQKMESVGQLAGGVAHDFNNLLTVILSSCGFLAEELHHGDPLFEDVGQIKAAGERAVSLTRQLLAFSRRQALCPEVLNLDRLLKDLNRMLGRLIGEDIEFITKTCPGLWSVKADPGQIEQVVEDEGAVRKLTARPGNHRFTIRRYIFPPMNRPPAPCLRCGHEYPVLRLNPCCT